MFALALATSLVLSPVWQDKWEIKPQFTPKTESTLKVSIDIEGMGSHAEFTAFRTISSSDDKGAKGKLGWKNITLDGQPVGEDEEFTAVFGLRGNVVSVEHQFGDEMRRMTAPLVFIYPDKPIGVGDKWEFTFKPSGDNADKLLTWSYEAKAVEKVKDQDAMKITAKFDEKGSEGMHGSGDYWLAKDGKILKIDLNVKSWPVPMAGQNMNVRIVATAGK